MSEGQSQQGEGAAGATGAAAGATGATAATGSTGATGATATAGATGATGAAASGATGATGAPEKYEFKAPDGVTLDTDLVAGLEGIAKDLKLSQADAQRIADLGVKLSQKHAATADAEAKAQLTEWETQAKADKEFGGTKFAENLGIAKTAMTNFGSPALVEFLNDSGLGSHPEVIRMFLKVGKAISEDSLASRVPGEGVNQGASLNQRAAATLWPTTQQ